MTKRTKIKSSKALNKRKKHLGFGFIFGAICVAAFVLYLGYNNFKTNSISSFEECVEAGNPVMESYPRQCSTNGKMYIESLDEDNTSMLLQIDKSENGKYLYIERGNYIINSIDEWEEIFGEMDINPNVDFSKKTVLAVVMGQKPTGGYSVVLRQIEVSKDSIQFLVEEQIPGPNCFVTQMITNPYQIIAIEKTNKEIKFVGNTVTNSCLE